MTTRSALALSSALLFVLPSVSTAQGARFGAAVSSADVNGDGFADVIVGEPFHDGSHTDEGRVLVYHGSASGPAATPSWTSLGLQGHAHFGAALAGVGDVNGDGFEDVAIAAPDFDAPRPSLVAGPGAARFAGPFRDAGLLVVFLGSPAGLGASPVLVRAGIQNGEHLGGSVSAAGDVDGDGFDDVLAGATGANNRRGAAFLFAGSAGGPSAQPVWTAVGPAQDSRFGHAVSGGGDVNNDGFADVLVGAPDAGSLGAAYVYYGSSTGLPSSSSLVLSPPGGDDGYDNGISDWGAHLCLAGDLNGDGFDEALIGNPTYDANLGHGSGVAPDSGVISIYRGSASGLLPNWAARRSGASSTSAAAGDLDGDGRDDVVFGPFMYFDVLPISLVDYGHPTYFISGSHLVAGNHFATGDVDGDGFDDLLAADTEYNLPTTSSGAVYIYRGYPGDITSETWILTAP